MKEMFIPRTQNHRIRMLLVALALVLLAAPLMALPVAADHASDHPLSQTEVIEAASEAAAVSAPSTAGVTCDGLAAEDAETQARFAEACERFEELQEKFASGALTWNAPGR